MTIPDYRITEFPPESAAFRKEIRAFLDDALKHLPRHERARSWTGVDLEFTRKLGQMGWIGSTLPKEYGGGGRSSLERYVLVEELLTAGAPVAAHWAADRQSGPLILHYGTEKQRQMVLPRICAGECFVCIGMSEPAAGSDLAAIATTARMTDKGYVVNGSKIWTSGADRAHYMILLCRTDTKSTSRHAGVSQILVDMSLPGIKVEPILDISGRRIFNHVFFEDVVVPADMLIGEEGSGWDQVRSELALERSGPDRFLSSFVLFMELVKALSTNPTDRAREVVGRLLAHVHVLRQMSVAVAAMFDEGVDPTLQAVVVKDLGADFEQDLPEIARLVVDTLAPEALEEWQQALAATQLIAPAYSLRGGTRDILRGMIAKGLGLR